jgi:hypothetical protein
MRETLPPPRRRAPRAPPSGAPRVTRSRAGLGEPARQAVARARGEGERREQQTRRQRAQAAVLAGREARNGRALVLLYRGLVARAGGA